jgi:hypothetical protein
MTTGTSSMSTTSIHVTLPQALKDHIEKRVAEGEFTSPSDYVRALAPSGPTRKSVPPSSGTSTPAWPTSRQVGSMTARRSSPSS